MRPDGKCMQAAPPPTTRAARFARPPQECKGNKLQACAQAHFSNLSMQMDLFRCQGAAYPDSVVDMQSCAEAAGMEWAPILACYDGDEGDALIAANAKRTAALNPPHAGVPWVVVNDAPVDDRDQLLAAICDAYVGAKPSCCAGLTLNHTAASPPRS